MIERIHTILLIYVYIFEKFKAAHEFFGIQTEDICNYDETGFRVGIGRAHEVITRLKSRRLYLSDPDNRETVTASTKMIRFGYSNRRYQRRGRRVETRDKIASR
jgi:hypothetical protein